MITFAEDAQDTCPRVQIFRYCNILINIFYIANMFYYYLGQLGTSMQNEVPVMMPLNWYLPQNFEQNQIDHSKQKDAGLSNQTVVKIQENREPGNDAAIENIVFDKGQGGEKPKLKDRPKPKEGRCQEYIPYISKKKPKKKVFQNAKRNIMPNIVHQKRKKSGGLVQKYLKSLNEPTFSVERFYNYQKLLKDKTNHYINEKGIKELNTFQDPECLIYSTQEQIVFIKIHRILAQYFLRNEIQPVILTSTRMKEETRRWHLQAKRRLLEEFNFLADVS